MLLQEKLKLVTVLGAGLLVGTALAVIIPEGVNAMYNDGGECGQDCKLLISYTALEQHALWVGYRIDPLPCHACRKRRLRQEQLTPRIKGLV